MEGLKDVTTNVYYKRFNDQIKVTIIGLVMTRTIYKQFGYEVTRDIPLWVYKYPNGKLARASTSFFSETPWPNLPISNF